MARTNVLRLVDNAMTAKTPIKSSPVAGDGDGEAGEIDQNCALALCVLQIAATVACDAGEPAETLRYAREFWEFVAE